MSDLDGGILDVGVGEDVGPEGGSLVGVVDFHHCELLHELLVDLQLVLLELGDDLLAEVDRHDVDQNA